MAQSRETSKQQEQEKDPLGDLEVGERSIRNPTPQIWSNPTLSPTPPEQSTPTPLLPTTPTPLLWEQTPADLAKANVEWFGRPRSGSVASSASIST